MIRCMKGADIEGAMRLKDAAGWNQTVQDWQRILRLQPDGCFIDERDGVIAGSATALRYGRELAWIGMVLVLPAYRRRGIATALMRHVLGWLYESGNLVSKLDATEMGRPLYERLGFREECAIERWARPPLRNPGGDIPKRPAAGTTDLSPSVRIDAAFDRAEFGCDRRALFRDLASDPAVESLHGEFGFVYGRPGSQAWFVGPCVAQNTFAAASLLGRLLQRHRCEPTYWDLLPANDSARRLATDLGFHPVRRLTRMVRIDGDLTSAPACTERIYAIAGFEFG